jgi:hypothetical protein
MSNIVFTFGRMNPPTKGHERLVTKVVETARSLTADHIVFISQTINPKTDPLDWNFKLRVCESAFRGVNISKDSTIRSPYLAVERLSETYNNVTMVVGSDQVNEFRKGFANLAERLGIEFFVISAGNRIDESDGIEGISASKMRQYARANNKEAFFNGLPGALNENIKELVYKNTQKGLKRP